MCLRLPYPQPLTLQPQPLQPPPQQLMQPPPQPTQPSPLFLMLPYLIPAQARLMLPHPILALPFLLMLPHPMQPLLLLLMLPHPSRPLLTLPRPIPTPTKTLQMAKWLPLMRWKLTSTRFWQNSAKCWNSPVTS